MTRRALVFLLLALFAAAGPVAAQQENLKAAALIGLAFVQSPVASAETQAAAACRAIRITSLPPYNSTQDLQGRVVCKSAADYDDYAARVGRFAPRIGKLRPIAPTAASTGTAGCKSWRWGRTIAKR